MIRMRSEFTDRVEGETMAHGDNWQVYDYRTGFNVGRPMASRKRARAKADRLDLQYGAIRYGVRCVEVDRCPDCTPIADGLSDVSDMIGGR